MEYDPHWSHMKAIRVRILWKALQSLNHIGARGFQTSDVIMLVACANVDVIATATRHTLGPRVGVPVYHSKDEVVDVQGLWS